MAILTGGQAGSTVTGKPSAPPFAQEHATLVRDPPDEMPVADKREQVFGAVLPTPRHQVAQLNPLSAAIVRCAPQVRRF